MQSMRATEYIILGDFLTIDWMFKMLMGGWGILGWFGNYSQPFHNSIFKALQIWGFNMTEILDQIPLTSLTLFTCLIFYRG